MAIDSFEQQALERAARMYGGFDRRQENQPPHPHASDHGYEEHQPPAHRHPHDPPHPPVKDPPPIPSEKPPERPPGLLEALMEDKEQSLILLLLIILMKDGADLELIMALLYLIL